MNTNLKLNSKLSFKALELKSYKTSAISDATRTKSISPRPRISKPRKSTATKETPIIDQQVKSFFQNVTRIYNVSYEVSIGLFISFDYKCLR
ncbi:MAG: hypothetical protein NC230_04515 [Bacteroides sp.]|nr:hypothetical protein [Bacteroides sp.]